MKAIIAVPVTLAMVYRAWSNKSLTPGGIIAASLTAAAHAVHPWSLPFALLITFFVAGTRVTKVKHDVKAKMTVQSSGSGGGEGARTHIQVLANSAVASVLSLLHAYQLGQREQGPEPECFSWPGDLLVVGIIANYAAVAADTFSSELGILAKSHPRLVTSITLRKVPPGTNGGVTGKGIAAGFLGSLIIVTVSMALVPFCAPANPGWNLRGRNRFAFAMAIWGTIGSLLDSFLGGWLQQSVVDTRTGRIVEGEGGKKVLVSKEGHGSMDDKKRVDVDAAIKSGERKPGNTQARSEAAGFKVGHKDPSRVVESGSLGLLDNNEVNFLMALSMSIGAMGIASWFWDIPFSSILSVEG